MDEHRLLRALRWVAVSREVLVSVRLLVRRTWVGLVRVLTRRVALLGRVGRLNLIGTAAARACRSLIRDVAAAVGASEERHRELMRPRPPRSVTRVSGWTKGAASLAGEPARSSPACLTFAERPFTDALHDEGEQPSGTLHNLARLRTSRDRQSS